MIDYLFPPYKHFIETNEEILESFTFANEEQLMSFSVEETIIKCLIFDFHEYKIMKGSIKELKIEKNKHDIEIKSCSDFSTILIILSYKEAYVYQMEISNSQIMLTQKKEYFLKNKNSSMSCSKISDDGNYIALIDKINENVFIFNLKENTSQEIVTSNCYDHHFASDNKNFMFTELNTLKIYNYEKQKTMIETPFSGSIIPYIISDEKKLFYYYPAENGLKIIKFISCINENSISLKTNKFCDLENSMSEISSTSEIINVHMDYAVKQIKTHPDQPILIVLLTGIETKISFYCLETLKMIYEICKKKERIIGINVSKKGLFFIKTKIQHHFLIY